MLLAVIEDVRHGETRILNSKEKTKKYNFIKYKYEKLREQHEKEKKTLFFPEDSPRYKIDSVIHAVKFRQALKLLLNGMQNRSGFRWSALEDDLALDLKFLVWPGLCDKEISMILGRPGKDGAGTRLRKLRYCHKEAVYIPQNRIWRGNEPWTYTDSRYALEANGAAEHENQVEAFGEYGPQYTANLLQRPVDQIIYHMKKILRGEKGYKFPDLIFKYYGVKKGKENNGFHPLF